MIVAGTAIATPDGDTPAETLRAGDYVMALENGRPVARPLRWVGRLEVDLARHPAPARAARSLAPDLAAVPSAAVLDVWKDRGCTMLRLDTAAVVPAHAVVVGRAQALGWALSPDPDLRVLANDAAAPLVRFSAEHYQARLPAGTRAVRLLSRHFIPNDFDPGIADRRRLGVAVRGLKLGSKGLPAGAFGRGWHLSEPEWRWTDGDARLSVRALPAAATLEIRIAPTAVRGYWVHPA